MPEETLRVIFAKNLKHYMGQMNRTQTDLCKYMKVSSATVSDWCNGRKMPRADKIQTIAKWLGVNIGDLMQENSNYYINDETAKVAQKIFENRELRVLFDAARDASPEDLRTTYDMLMALKRKEQNTDDDTGC